MRQCKNEFQNPDRKSSHEERSLKPKHGSLGLPEDLFIVLLDVTGRVNLQRGSYINRYTEVLPYLVSVTSLFSFVSCRPLTTSAYVCQWFNISITLAS